MRAASLVLLFITSFVTPPVTQAQEPAEKPAPPRFTVRFESSRGDIEIHVEREWAPLGTDRFYHLVRSGYYDGARFFRVVAGRWAQFGINGNPSISKAWRHRVLPDDPRKQSNVRGVVAFAWAVPNGRTTQVFINLGDNSETLDRQGFAPFGRVTRGMEVVDALYSGYGEESGGGIRAGKQDLLFELGNVYLLERYPRLDYIRRAIIEAP